VARVFVSYARSDGAAARELAARLRVLGHQPWMDENLAPGQPWWAEVRAQIHDADLVVALVSDAWLGSSSCARELRYADLLGKATLRLAVDGARCSA
jgi:hypothetical protein